MPERLLGTYQDDGYMQETIKVYVDAKINDGRLSITASVYAGRKAERNLISCGQSTDCAALVTTPGPGLTMDDVRRLREVWDHWHLNDMRPGCVHQRGYGWDAMHVLESRGRYAGMSRARQKAFKRIDRPCPVCGYRYGSAWLTEELPADVVQFIAAFNGEV